MIVFEEPEEERPLNLLPCAGCHAKKVLKKGDYCKDCASVWGSSSHDYFIVDTNTLDDVAEVSGIARSYLKAKQEDAFMRYCTYIVFYAQGKWKEVNINNRFYIPAVMKNIIRRYQDG